MEHKKQNEISEEVLVNAITIKDKIYIIRGKKVMFDKDLAELYEVPTKRLNEAVKRNLNRFPEDFMFQLTKEEISAFSRSHIVTLKNTRRSRSQFATLKQGENIKYAPLAFTEQGIAMLSSVLNSDRAIAVNIQIIRIFTTLREMINVYRELREKVEEMEKNNETHFTEIFRVLRVLITENKKPKERIGF